MTDYFAVLLMTYTAFLLAVLSPGPNLKGVLNISLSHGRSAGLLMGIGIAIGSLAWVAIISLVTFSSSPVWLPSRPCQCHQGQAGRGAADLFDG